MFAFSWAGYVDILNWTNCLAQNFSVKLTFPEPSLYFVPSPRISTVTYSVPKGSYITIWFLPSASHDDINVSTSIAIFVRSSALASVVTINKLPVIKNRISALINTLNICILNIVLLIISKMRAFNLNDSQLRTSIGYRFNESKLIHSS